MALAAKGSPQLRAWKAFIATIVASMGFSVLSGCSATQRFAHPHQPLGAYGVVAQGEVFTWKSLEHPGGSSRVVWRSPDGSKVDGVEIWAALEKNGLVDQRSWIDMPREGFVPKHTPAHMRYLLNERDVGMLRSYLRLVFPRYVQVVCVDPLVAATADVPINSPGGLSIEGVPLRSNSAYGEALMSGGATYGTWLMPSPELTVIHLESGERRTLLADEDTGRFPVFWGELVFTRSEDRIYVTPSVVARGAP